MALNCVRMDQANHAMAIWKNYSTGDYSPVTNPTAHLADLLFHSSFDYYAPAAGFPQDVSHTHSAISADTGTDVSGGLGIVIAYTSVTESDITLCAHGLAYVPNFMVSINGVQYTAGCPIQTGANGARRCLTYWADSTNIYVRDSARPSTQGLSSIALTHHITVFRQSAIAGQPLFKADLGGSSVEMGYGRVPASDHIMREPDTGDPTYAVPAGEVMSIANGRFRFALPNGGTIFDVGPILGVNTYTGSFFGGAVKNVFIT